MRLSKSLLCGISALLLVSGAAFAGQDSTVRGSVETSPPELLSDERSDPYIGPMPEGMSDQSSMEITEHYLLIPSESSEMSG